MNNLDKTNHIIVELFSMDFPKYNLCVTMGEYYDVPTFCGDLSSDEYLIVKGVPSNFKKGDLIKYPSNDYTESKQLGYIVYMQAINQDYGVFVIGVKHLDFALDNNILWFNKFKKFVFE